MSSARPALRRLVVLGAVGAVAASGALLIEATPAVAATATRYVATSGNDGGGTPNSCTVKAKPCKTIQHAVDEAASGDTVSVAAGKYAESLVVIKSLTIAGPTSGKATINGASAGETTLTVGGEEDDAPSVHLRNLDLSGNTSGPGVVTLGSDLTVVDSTISHNAQVGVVSEYGSLSVTDSTIADSVGTGVLNIGSTVDITHSAITGTTGSTTSGPFAPGSGVDTLAGTTTLTGATVSGNAGPGVYTVDAGEIDEPGIPTLAAPAVKIHRSTVSGNDLFGLAIGPGTTAAVDTSTVSGNGGSNVLTESSDTTITNSTIAGAKAVSGDEADGFGGTAQAGVVALPPLSAITQGLNKRAASPSIFARPSGVSTFQMPRAMRTAQVKVKAAAADPENGPTVISLSGSVVSDNGDLPDCATPTTITVGDARAADADSPIVDHGYNLSSDAKNTCGFSAAEHDLIKTAPKLGALADNGGSTKTQLPATNSPVIDAVAAGSAGCVKGATDQRGVSRPQGARCDIGAVEVAMASPLVITTSSLPDGTVGKAYHARLHAKGGTDSKYVWSLAPGSTLPGGLTLSPAGVLSGTPTDAGTSSVTVSVNDPVTKKFSLTIAAAPAAGRGPNGGGNEPIANTGPPIGSLSAVGIGTVLAGLLLMVAAGVIGKRQGRVTG